MAEIGVLGLLGCGNMGGAVARGALRSRLIRPDALRVFDPEPRAVLPFTEQGASALPDPASLIRACDTVVLAVKPQVFKAEGGAWRSALAGLSGKTLISVMAGIRVQNLREAFPGHTVVRVMPNLGLSIGEGATAIATDGVDEEVVGLVEKLFGACGITVRSREADLDAVTGLSGSGPMYVFEFVEALTEAGVKAGLAREAAYALVLQTLKGSVALLAGSTDAPSVWSARVRSPGGTTERGQKVLQERGFHDIVIEAVRAAAARSQELSG